MQNLAASLNRLLEAVRQTSEALQRLSDALESSRTETDPDAIRHQSVRIPRSYVASGCPFGTSETAARIWARFGQRTTVN